MKKRYFVLRSLKMLFRRPFRLNTIRTSLAACGLFLSVAGYSQGGGSGCPSANISYGQTNFCANQGTSYATLSGSAGGSFSSTSGLSINSSTGSINPMASTAGTYTVNYHLDADGSCPASNATASVTIMGGQSVESHPNVSVCAGSTVNLNPFSGSTSGMTYNWTNDNTSIGLASSGSGNISNFTGTNNGTEQQVAHIRVIGTYTQNGVTCNTKPMSFVIRINPVPVMDAVGNMTQCNGESASSYQFTSSTSGDGVRYYWENSNSSIGLDRSGYDMLPAYTATNTGNTQQTSTITVTPYYTAGARCFGTPRTFTIAVNPSTPGAASFSYTGSPYCSTGGTVSPSFTSGSNNGNWSSTSGLSINSSTGAVNTGTSTAGTYTVTYRYGGGAGTCASVNTTTITINPGTASIGYGDGSAYCGNTSGSTFPTMSGANGGTFSSSAGLDVNGSNGAINWSNSTAGTYTVNYSVNQAGCGNVNASTQVTIIGTPSVDPVSNVVVCAGSTVSAINFSSSNAPGATYSWTSSGNGLGLASSGSGNIGSFTATNNMTQPISEYVYVTPSVTQSGSTCSGRRMAFRILVMPTPTVTQVSNQTVCQNGGATSGINWANNMGNGTTYSWTNSNTGIGLGASGTGNLPSFTPTAGSATISVTGRGTNGCQSPAMTFTYNVNNCGTVAAGVEGERTTNALTLAPNPAHTQLTVSYAKGGNLTLQVLDQAGQVQKTVRGFSGNGTIDISNLRPGSYVLQVTDAARGTSTQQSFIKL